MLRKQAVLKALIRLYAKADAAGLRDLQAALLPVIESLSAKPKPPPVPAQDPQSASRPQAEVIELETYRTRDKRKEG
jgi:hypothetical protein